jgi:hypothetical protein
MSYLLYCTTNPTRLMTGCLKRQTVTLTGDTVMVLQISVIGLI